MFTDSNFDEQRTTATREPHPLCAMIRNLRQAGGLSLKQFELKTGLPAVVIGAYERGDRIPPLSKLEQIYEAFGYRLVAVPASTEAVRLPTDIVADLRAIANQLEHTAQVRGAAPPEDTSISQTAWDLGYEDTRAA